MSKIHRSARPTLRLTNLPVDILNIIIADLNYQDRYKLCVIGFCAECGLNASALDLPVNIWPEFVSHIRWLLRTITGVGLQEEVIIPYNKDHEIAKLFVSANPEFTLSMFYNHSTDVHDKFISSQRIYMAINKPDLSDIVAKSTNKYSPDTNVDKPKWMYTCLVKHVLEIARKHCVEEYTYANIECKHVLIYNLYISLFYYLFGSRPINNHLLFSGGAAIIYITNFDILLTEFKSVFNSILLFWKHQLDIAPIEDKYLLNDPYSIYAYNTTKYYISYRNTCTWFRRSPLYILSNIQLCFKPALFYSDYQNNMIKSLKEYIKSILLKSNVYNLYCARSNSPNRISIEDIQIDINKAAYSAAQNMFHEYYIYEGALKHVKRLIECLKQDLTIKSTIADATEMLSQQCGKSIISSNIRRDSILIEIFGNIDTNFINMKKKDYIIYTVVKQYLESPPTDYMTIARKRLLELNTDLDPLNIPN